jgi:hypothetical protein
VSPISDFLSGVAYGSGTFVAVGQDAANSVGTILTSPDGITWTRTSPTSNALYGVTYANGIFVAVGYEATILTSTDGITWASRASPTSASLYGAAYGNGTFVVVGDGETILSSSDGVTWTVRTSPTSNALYGVTYGNGTFVAVGSPTSGNMAVIITSTDGITWTPRTSPNVSINGVPYGFNGVTYGDGLFLAFGGSGTSLLSSTDGITWAFRAVGNITGMTYAHGTFVAIGSAVLSSTDGMTWTPRTDGIGLNAGTFGKGTFVLVGVNGRILQSDNVLNQCSPNIEVNGSKTSITFGTKDTMSVTISLDAENLSGSNADWWVAASTPMGWYYYVYPGQWYYAETLDDIGPAYQGPLFNLPPLEVLNISGLPAGRYVFYFGVDTKMNGRIDFDQLFLDDIVMDLIP